MIQKTFKYRIYPTKEQELFLSKQFGSTRFVFNYFLNERKLQYLENKKHINYYDTAKSLTELKTKDGYEWLNDVNSQTLQYSLRTLDISFHNFFQKRAGFPRFKKKSNDQCIRIPQHFSIENGKIFIPKLKTGIKINLHTPLSGKIGACSIRKTCTNKYYVSILCECEIKSLKKNKNSIGIDVGIKNLVSTNDGIFFENPKTLQKYQKKLSYLQRQLAKKKRGSSKYKKLRIKIAKIHEMISNIRNDNLHKISRKLINENQVIISETLSVANMLKNHRLAKSISDCAWGELFRQFSYKSEWYGRTYYQIDKYFPSSKMCNNCKFVVDELPLNIRDWICPHCGTIHNRDTNAAKNILEQGLTDLGLRNAIPYQKSGEAILPKMSLNREALGFIQG